MTALADRSVYERVLHLRHLRLRTWQRLLLAEGSAVLGVLLAMAEVASAWVVLVLPGAVALMVLLHDAVEGELQRLGRARGTPTAPDSSEAGAPGGEPASAGP